MRYLYIAFILLLLPVVVFAQDVTVKTELEKNKILIGDQIELKYIVEKNNDYSVQFPLLSKTIGENIEIIDSARIDSVKLKKKKRQVTLHYTITAFDTGLFYIPPHPVIIKNKQFTDTMFSSDNYLEVKGVAIDSTNTIRDIKNIHELKFPWSKAVGYGLAILFDIFIILLILYFTVFRKSNKALFGVRKPSEAPHIIALRELDKLKAEKTWQKGSIKEYYSRLTFIVRNYIEKRFGIKALEETSYEILTDFKKVNRNKYKYKDDVIRILEGLLSLADLVKFAKNEPLPDENVTHLEKAYVFIKSTMVREEETKENEEKQGI